MRHLSRNIPLSQLLLIESNKRQLARLIVPMAQFHGKKYIGKRDVVGYGYNGSYIYSDTVSMPFPAIRFREENDEIRKLREKEKGDWNKLSLEEKRKLYRHNFCLTLSEIDAPTGEWKFHIASIFYTFGLVLFYFGYARQHFFGPLPESMTPEGKQHQRDLEIQYKANPIFGLASKFDYEKGDWK